MFKKKWTERRVNRYLHRLGNVLLLIIAFAMFVMFLGFDMMLPNGPVWATILIWATAQFAGRSCEAMGIPGLLGMLIAGIIMKNLPGDPLQGLPETWGETLRAFGLSLILMRSGLELDIGKLLKQGWIVARLTVMPGMFEAFTVAGMGMVIFKMPFALSLAGGFILAAVSPAVVVSGMFDLQAKGYGIIKGIPSLVVAAASFDDVVAISGFAMCIGVAVESGEDPVLDAMHGPINLIGGCVAGIIGGTICGCTRIWNTKVKRTLVTLLIGLFFMFGAVKIHFNGGGALAGLVTTIVAARCWQNNTCAPLSLGPSNNYHHEVEHHIAKIWENIAMPLLFGVIGASVDFSEVDVNVIPKSLLLVFIGTCIRVPTAIFASAGKDLTMLERAFIGLSWIPKATVQAALGSIPLDIIRETMDKDDPDFDKYERWGKEILVTAVVSILFTAPIGLICINKLGPRWLRHTERGDPDECGSIISEKPEAQENWAINEFQRRVSYDQLTAINHLHTSRFFGRILDEYDRVETTLKYLAEEHPENKDVVDSTMESMSIIHEGIDSAWRVINDQGGEFPTAALFETKAGSFKNQPTEKELLLRLESMLSECEDLSGNIELPGRRRSFTVVMTTGDEEESSMVVEAPRRRGYSV